MNFIRRYVFSTDHKVIGIQYFLTAMLMAIIGGALAALIRLSVAWPTQSWPLLGKLFPYWMQGGYMKPEFYIALVTMHGTIMVFFVISFALLSGFGNFVIPLQIGARDMAYPFLNMLSYWVVVPACIVMIASFFVEGGAAASGWTAYPPLSALAAAIPGSQLGQTLWLLGMALFIISFTMGSLNFVVTILAHRTKGLSMMRLPLLIWAMLIASILGLLAFPPLTAAAILLLFDRHGGTSFFLPTGLYVGDQLVPNQGGTPLLWQHLFWFLGHPEVYVLIFPALGVTLDLIPTFTRKPIFGYKPIVYSFYAIATLGMVVWGHHMFVSGMSPFIGEVFAIGTLAITIPSAIIGFDMLASLWGGRLQLTTPMLFVLGVIAFFGTGGFGGLFLGNATSDIQLHDTYFVVGHFHFMIGGVTLLSIFAGTYYWFPKMFGRMMSETLGRVHFWLTVIPFYIVFLGQHFLGLAGMPRRYYAFDKFAYLESLENPNRMLTIVSFVLMAGQLVFLFNFFWSLARGAKAAENPWEANTLEWSTASPPPHGNWHGARPVVHRWPYDYSLPGQSSDFAPQTMS